MEWILLVLPTLGILALMYEYAPRSPEGELRHLLWKWEQDCKRRGLTPEQQDAELRFREAWVRLRRRANEAIIADAETYEKALSDIAKEEANRLALTDKRVAKRFLDVVVASSNLEILYADGMKALHAYRKPFLEEANRMVEEFKKTPDYAQHLEDQLNALR